jgi:hypothetical protein
MTILQRQVERMLSLVNQGDEAGARRVFRRSSFSSEDFALELARAACGFLGLAGEASGVGVFGRELFSEELRDA